MDNQELLQTYRKLARELRVLQEQRAQLDEQLHYQQHDPLAALRLKSCLAQVDQMIADVKQQRDALQQAFDTLADQADSGFSQIVVRQYYGMSLSDAAIADISGCCTRTVYNYRTQFLRRLSCRCSAKPTAKRRKSCPERKKRPSPTSRKYSSSTQASCAAK